MVARETCRKLKDGVNPFGYLGFHLTHLAERQDKAKIVTTLNRMYEVLSPPFSDVNTIEPHLPYFVL